MFCLSATRSSTGAAFLLRRGAAGSPSSSLARCASSAATARLFSSAKPEEPEEPRFDAETSRLYKIIAQSHRHPSGPWVTMLEVNGGNFRALDLATGPGEPAATIARHFPECTVVATDVSPDQVAIANEQTATLPHLSAQVADMANLCDFEDASFDVVTCCYGYMFPDDKAKAVAESYRVLKPGGTVFATTWNRVGMMEKLRAIMTDVLGETPPPPPMNPLSLNEPGLFESMLTDAGFSDIAMETHEYPFDMTKDPETQFKVSVLLVKEKLDELDAWDKAKEAYEKHKDDYGACDDNGHWLILGNEYKLTVAIKK